MVIDVDTLGNLRPISKVVFSLGSNVGDSLEILQSAINELATTPDLIPVDLSSVYLTAPVGDVRDQDDFYNLVFVAETTLEPLTLLERAEALESAFGRVREQPGGPRTLDIDLIMVGKRERADDRLVLPHPRAHERAFVLVPWLEADPLGELAGHGTLVDLVAGLDTSGVTRIDERIDLP
ncbi:2-amino-4-hydroxy-6-hydroxymethyldihydropteridine diphosphokinase [Aestuariimicrobium kwangyangense]|uniref:2-amino-4-hydroxy-6- hydroxymethyldihydropteridine diphosphokinase n=1 Tax=Aestuariimicrobium kwangyangense TaxID=396389 RepID=UPI0003B3A8AE|nr:2-amino-4-hydroxy-6-hydroxymethyldihydropteridine diphosphokinase [Aestuariimicrobium kwangyangense]